MRVVVIGAGRVGGAIARDLHADESFDVVVTDRSADALARLAGDGLAVEACDALDPAALSAVVADVDLAVGAVPGFMGFATARRVLEAGADLVDISFFAEDAFELDGLARERGRRVVVDAGVAPGLSNLAYGAFETDLDDVQAFACWVGGLPAVRRGPWEYAAPFSPVDVIEEYTRPARLRRGGAEVTLPALSELEHVTFEGVGELEGFVTDGLRTMLRTCDAPDMTEKTLRYPGHAAKIEALRSSGFFSETPLDVGGVEVPPAALTARLLERAWSFEEGEEDLTVMRVDVRGSRDGGTVTRRMDLLDRFDRASGTTSMARTTGYTCTSLVRWIREHGPPPPGVTPPEVLGRLPGCFEFVVARLAERGVRLVVEELTSGDAGQPAGPTGTRTT